MVSVFLLTTCCASDMTFFTTVQNFEKIRTNDLSVARQVSALKNDMLRCAGDDALKQAKLKDLATSIFLARSDTEISYGAQAAKQFIEKKGLDDLGIIQDFIKAFNVSGFCYGLSPLSDLIVTLHRSIHAPDDLSTLKQAGQAMVFQIREAPVTVDASYVGAIGEQANFIKANALPCDPEKVALLDALGLYQGFSDMTFENTVLQEQTTAEEALPIARQLLCDSLDAAVLTQLHDKIYGAQGADYKSLWQGHKAHLALQSARIEAKNAFEFRESLRLALAHVDVMVGLAVPLTPNDHFDRLAEKIGALLSQGCEMQDIAQRIDAVKVKLAKDPKDLSCSLEALADAIILERQVNLNEKTDLLKEKEAIVLEKDGVIQARNTLIEEAKNTLSKNDELKQKTLTDVVAQVILDEKAALLLSGTSHVALLQDWLDKSYWEIVAARNDPASVIFTRPDANLVMYLVPSASLNAQNVKADKILLAFSGDEHFALDESVTRYLVDGVYRFLTSPSTAPSSMALAKKVMDVRCAIPAKNRMTGYFEMDARDQAAFLALFNDPA